MKELSTIHLRRLHGILGDVAYQLAQVQFTQMASPGKWRPAINAYRCTGQIAICVDLAGVTPETLDLRVHGRRLIIGGRRESPEPAGTEPRTLQVLAMEIDYGHFERQIELPMDVDAERVNAEQRNGLVWIHLPLLSQS